MKKRAAFTMLELVFVIAVMGIIGKFGVEFLAQAYKSFIYSSVNQALHSNSTLAVQQISSRLQNRLRDSVIARTGAVVSYTSLSSVSSATTYTVLEWVAVDEEGFRGLDEPHWSGIIDVNDPTASINLLVSPATNTTKANQLILNLSNSNSDINDSSLYFVGSNNDIDGYGWDGNAIIDQNQVMHPIEKTGNENQFAPQVGNFSGVTIYEYYKLAWTANAIVLENYNTGKYAGLNMGDLLFYYDYQPWAGEKFYDAGVKKAILMENVSTFAFTAIGSVIKIQVCVKSEIIDGRNDNGGYSLCKEKTIF